jgi:hypothetical protein
MTSTVLAAPVDIVAEVIDLLNRVSADLRRVLVDSRPTSGNPNTSEARAMALRRLIVLALGSPEFQRRYSIYGKSR